MRPHIVVESKVNGISAIKLLEEPYSGIIFTYGKVSFDEDDANMKLKINFEYEILDSANKEWDKELFEEYLGDFLQELIRDGIEQNNLTYTGGTDAD
jgi:hypothetical protein